MNSFTGLPLEMEPLPSLFPFSPCATASYSHARPERPTHDVADVLLSLKNAVLKPNGETHPCQASSLQASQNSYGNSSNGALSYTVHHPQILLSPSSHHHYYQCHQNQSQGSYNSSNSYYDSSSCAAHNHYPSMSLNVSMNMNMTMHGYPDVPCSQMQWNPPSSNSSAALCPPFSPVQPYPPPHSYSFTADFRSPSHLSGGENGNSNTIASHNLDEEPILESVKMSTSPLPIEQKPFFSNTSTCFTSPKSDSVGLSSPLPYEVKPKIMSPSRNHANSTNNNNNINVNSSSYEPEDDSNNSNDDSAGSGKPNLCRLCGKTYARPSTLKVSSTFVFCNLIFANNRYNFFSPSSFFTDALKDT